MTQTVQADQVRVVNAGVVDTQNGRPALTAVTNRSHLNGVLNVNGAANLYLGLVCRTPYTGAVGVNAPNYLHWPETGAWGQVYVGANQTQIGWRIGTGQATTDRVATLASGASLSVVSIIKAGLPYYARVNGVNSPENTGLMLTANNGTAFRLMARAVDGTPFSIIGMVVCECIIALTPVTVPTLEANQASYYGIALA
jgi:hypothetical protein